MGDFSNSNGGSLWNANFLQDMKRVRDMEFIVVSTGPPQVQDSNQEFVGRLGFEHIFVAFRQAANSNDAKNGWGISASISTVLSGLANKYYFSFESSARQQRHIDTAVLEIVAAKLPDVIVIVYLFTTLLVPSILRLTIPRCLITVNNESAFQRAVQSNSGPMGEGVQDRLSRWFNRHFHWVSNRRVCTYEDRIYNRCTGIAALTQNDMPVGLRNRAVQAIIPPILTPSDLTWSYRGSRCLLFVGNIGHFANRLAMAWICNQFAPELARIDAGIRIHIIGASLAQVPETWQRPNVNFMGYANKAEVVSQMTTADLFIAPIENNFGAKLKLAECISHRMPFVATRGAMSGLSFLRSVPQIDLNRPSAATRLVVECINNREALEELSRSVASQSLQAREENIIAWTAFLNHSMGIGWTAVQS
jgi:hypothetical protein